MFSYSIIKKNALTLLCLATMQPLYAGLPVWSFTPLTPTKLTLSVNSSTTISYRVTNHSLKAKKLAMLPLTGVTQISPPCRLAPRNHPGDSCILNLRIDGNTLPAQGVKKGPVLCLENSNGSTSPLQCYQPAPQNRLNISKSTIPAQVTLNVTPTTVSFMAGTDSPPIVVTNNSTTTAANGLSLLSSANLSIVESTCGTCYFLEAVAVLKSLPIQPASVIQ